MDYENLRASDGTGEAALANITADRDIASTIIEVDNVDNWPDNFIVTTGTLDANGYIDSDTMCQMIAHLNGGNIEIDSFVAGYSDTGNTEGQVAIIKQTTVGQDTAVDLAQVAHNEDGSIKRSAVNNLFNPTSFMANFVASGGIWSQDSGLDGDMTALIFYIDGQVYTVDAVAGYGFTASKDTYIDVGADGTLDYTAEVNDDPAPALAAGHIRLAKVVTDGSGITDVVQTGYDSNGISIYQTESKIVEKIFTADQDWTKPENLKYVVVEVLGGGGGSGGCETTGSGQGGSAGGGGAGGYSRKKILAASLGSTEAVTVGAAGAAGSVGANDGGDGGISSFGSHLQATGGEGGHGASASGGSSGYTGGTGGVGSNGDFNIYGGQGTFGQQVSGVRSSKGNGGASYFGGGAGGTSFGAVAGQVPGSGAAGAQLGASTSQVAGAAGAAGLVIVREYF